MAKNPKNKNGKSGKNLTLVDPSTDPVEDQDTAQDTAQVVPEDDDEPSFGPGRNRTPDGMNRADRRAASKRIAEPMSLDDLLSETAPFDVFGNGRFTGRFYVHRFTADLIRPLEEIEARQMIIQDAVEERNRLLRLRAQSIENAQKALDRGETVEVPVIEIPPMPDMKGATGSDYFEAQIQFCLAVVADWSLRISKGGPKAPITAEFMRSKLGVDIVGRIVKCIRDSWKPGEMSSAASA